MEFSIELQKEMQRAFRMCRDVVRQFPPPFAESGVHYLNRFDPEHGNSSTNYICCLLPYWLRVAAKASIETCREIAEANIFGMLHFHLQDALIDQVSQKDRTSVILSQLFHAEMNVRYAALFPSASHFRQALLSCTSQWASGLAAEQRNDSFFERPQDLADRSAPLLLCPLVLFAEDPFLQKQAIHDVGEVLITLQMADDWADYKQDLQDGSYNCLVSLYRKEYAQDPKISVFPSDIDQAVYAKGMLSRYAQFSTERQLRLQQAQPYFPDLLDFHKALAGDLAKIAEQIEREKQKLALGGLHYWLMDQ
ncbi:hypothetical protein [Saccharibacillus sp. JS10]|uniref:hypothetical protein n=1 Tax=Saccharibacillus sp. JS10 TaxID=2950552 RepID=UPI00210B0A9B|nr:hypothetical protein [Saccharibacillus sp. JS10]MCQ4086622.1 hypothetical protein [Saccharibacillus sp. JS10]